jgi:hypothetical protein
MHQAFIMRRTRDPWGQGKTRAFPEHKNAILFYADTTGVKRRHKEFEIMESPVHSMRNLFAQLGLPSDQASIDQFITTHSPLPEGMKLADAPFWTPAQASFLREEILEDADWAEIVDQLNACLHG